MDKTAKKDLMFSLIAFFMILLSLLVIGAGQTADVPTITLDSPDALGTYDNQEGKVKINYSTAIPSGDTDVDLYNITLYTNFTSNINHTWFSNYGDTHYNYSINTTKLSYNQSKNITGITNVTEFANILNLPHGYYLNFQALVCTNVTGQPVDQGNCTFSTNTSLVIDWFYDETAPSRAAIDYPTNGSTIHNLSQMQINFTAIDDDYVQNITLYINKSLTFCKTACNVTNAEKNQTFQSSGAQIPFDNNSANTTIKGSFERWGNTTGLFAVRNVFNKSGAGGSVAANGFYCAYIEVYDFNTNSYNGTTIFWEMDNIEPGTSNFVNATPDNTCSIKEFKFNVSEESNISIYYGKNDSALASSVTDTDFTNGSLTINLTELNLSHTTYYYNITICDEHGNCNLTAHNVTSNNHFLKEWAACTGWNAYAVLDTSVRLRDVAGNISDSTLVSTWNETGQSWINYVGTSVNQNWTITRGDAAWAYTENDSIITQGNSFMETSNTTLTVPVNMSIYTDGNWTNFGLLKWWTLGNITANTNIEENATGISYWNNSANAYLDQIIGYSFNNDTVIGEGDVVWIWIKNSGSWLRNETYLNHS